MFTGRAEGVDPPPPFTVNLTVKYSFFYNFPNKVICGKMNMEQKQPPLLGQTLFDHSV